MNLKNIFISLIMVLLAVYGGFKWYYYYAAKSKIDILLSVAPMVGAEASYDRIATSIFGPVGVKGLKFRFPQFNEQVTFGEVMLEHFEYKENALPTRMHLEIEDMRFNMRLVDELEKSAGASRSASNHSNDAPEVLVQLGYQELFERSNDWRRLGYQEVTMDLGVDLQLRPGLNEATFIFTQNIKKMGSTRIFMDITEVPINKMPSVLGVKLREIRIDYKDDSYTDRVIKSYADEQGVDIETYRKHLLERIDSDIESKQIKLSSESVQNLKAFISKPDKITISMFPYQPVSVGSIKHYKPGDVPIVLNLRFIRDK